MSTSVVNFMSLAFVAVNVAEKYRPVAARGVLLCFVINNLHKIHSHVLFVVTEYICVLFLVWYLLC